MRGEAYGSYEQDIEVYPFTHRAADFDRVYRAAVYGKISGVARLLTRHRAGCTIEVGFRIKGECFHFNRFLI
jgi:hypothetical protein